NEEESFAALKSGAAACITKDADPNFLLETLRGVTQGHHPIIECFFLPEVAAKTMTEFEDIAVLSEQLDNTLASLSPKEREVLGLLAGGSNLEQAVAKLNITEANLRRHLREIVNKLLTNEQAKMMLQAAQRSMSGIILPGNHDGKRAANYVTRQEFNEFKDNLMERLKSFIGELA
ncbi:MAG: LuxR C-terminal-related transcriptional regulator, partial [Chloroflexota bacterium]